MTPTIYHIVPIYNNSAISYLTYRPSHNDPLLCHSHIANMAAKAAIRRQWNVFLQSRTARTSTSQWAASVAILASVSAAVAIHDDDSEHSGANPGSIDALLPPRTQRSVRCEAEMFPFQRSSQISENSSSAPVVFGPWKSESSANSRKSLLRRHTKHGSEIDTDMNEKYDIDFDTVLGEGVSNYVSPCQVTFIRLIVLFYTNNVC